MDKASNKIVAKWQRWLLAAILVVTCGVVYRLLAYNYGRSTGTNIAVQLEDLPDSFGGWSATGNCTSQRVSGKVELQRHYINEATGGRVQVYVVHTNQPALMLGHRPDVCYAGDGWTYDGQQQWQFETASSRTIACKIHRFHKPIADYEELVVLSFYVLGGEIVSEQASFESLKWQTANPKNDSGHYLGQVQIISRYEGSVRQAAQMVADEIVTLLLDKERFAGSLVNGFTKSR